MDERELKVFNKLQIKISHVMIVIAVITIILKLLIGWASLLFSFLPELVLLIGLLIINNKAPKTDELDERLELDINNYYQKSFKKLAIITLVIYFLTIFLDLKYIGEPNAIINFFILIVSLTIFFIIMIYMTKKEKFYLHSNIISEPFIKYIKKILLNIVKLFLFFTLTYISLVILDILLPSPRFALYELLVVVVSSYSIYSIMYLIYAIYEHNSYYEEGQRLNGTISLFDRNLLLLISLLFALPLLVRVNMFFTHLAIMKILPMLFISVQPSLTSDVLLSIILVLIILKLINNIKVNDHKAINIILIISFILILIFHVIAISLFLTGFMIPTKDYDLLINKPIIRIFYLIKPIISITTLLIITIYSIIKKNISFIFFTVTTLIFIIKPYLYPKNFNSIVLYLVSISIQTALLIFISFGLFNLNKIKIETTLE